MEAESEQYVSPVVGDVGGYPRHARHELCDNVRGLLRIPLENKVGAFNARDLDVRIDSLNLFERLWSDQAVLLALYEKNGYRDVFECALYVDGQDLTQACCENSRFDRADGRTNGFVQCLRCIWS